MAYQSHPLLGGADDAEPTCNILYIRRRLGRDDYREGRLVTYVRLLIERQNFPRPFPFLNTRTHELVEAATRRSRWQRPAVDQWFADYLPPEASAALDAAAHAAAAAEMDDAARALGNLRLVGAREA